MRRISFMPGPRRSGAAAAGILAVAALLAAAPAAAASHPRSCWEYRNSVGRWVNLCRTYSSRDTGPRVNLPRPFHYPFHFEPPYGGNGPYYGYEPYNGYQSALGIRF